MFSLHLRTQILEINILFYHSKHFIIPNILSLPNSPNNITLLHSPQLNHSAPDSLPHISTLLCSSRSHQTPNPFLKQILPRLHLHIQAIMGSAMSRCTNANKSTTGHTHHSFAEISQMILERQPNWLVTPSRWRSSGSSGPQSARYRTPTPYPKDDRKRLEEVIHIPEKAAVIEARSTPIVRPIEVTTKPPRQQKSMNSDIPHIQLPPSAISISWEINHPRVNRFERVA